MKNPTQSPTTRRCTYVTNHKHGWRCGSYAFNLYQEGIEQGDLCDVHYWKHCYDLLLGEVKDIAKVLEVSV